MPVVDVVNLKGNKVGQLDLLDAVFGVKVNQHPGIVTNLDNI